MNFFFKVELSFFAQLWHFSQIALGFLWFDFNKTQWEAKLNPFEFRSHDYRWSWYNFLEFFKNQKNIKTYATNMFHTCGTKFRNSDYGVAVISAEWYPMGIGFSFGCQILNFILVLDQNNLKRYLSSFKNIEINLCKISQCAPHGHAFGLSAR